MERNKNVSGFKGVLSNVFHFLTAEQPVEFYTRPNPKGCDIAACSPECFLSIPNF